MSRRENGRLVSDNIPALQREHTELVAKIAELQARADETQKEWQRVNRRLGNQRDSIREHQAQVGALAEAIQALGGRTLAAGESEQT